MVVDSGLGRHVFGSVVLTVGSVVYGTSLWVA